jgi:hypothetical protein
MLASGKRGEKITPWLVILFSLLFHEDLNI